MADQFWYPSVEDMLAIHEDIVSEYPDTSAGIRNRGDVEFALDYVQEGKFGSVPEAIHEKAFHCSGCSLPTTRSSTGTNGPLLTPSPCSTFSTATDSSTATKSDRFSSASPRARRLSTRSRRLITAERTQPRLIWRTQFRSGERILSSTASTSYRTNPRTRTINQPAEQNN